MVGRWTSEICSRDTALVEARPGSDQREFIYIAQMESNIIHREFGGIVQDLAMSNSID